MCGIIGFSGTKEKKLNIDKIKLLIYYNQDRGKESLGFYTPESGVYKEVGKPEDLMIKDSFEIPESSTFIGHTRQASVGDVSKENAHPFHHGNIILLMNGTLTNHWGLASDYKLVATDYKVDSEVLTAIINKTQSKEVLSKIQGGCSILYIDENTGKMYAFTNGGRPLFRGVLNGCMYISSTDSSLKLIGCLNVKPFKPDYLYTIENGSILTQTVVPKTKEVVKELLCYDQTGGYFYETLQLFAPAADLCKYWVTPDNDSAMNNIRFQFSYKCLGQLDGCKENQITIVNDLGEQVHVEKYAFKYRNPIIFPECRVFSINKLTFEGGDVFCEKGDLMYVIENKADNKYYCKNISNDKYGTVQGFNIRYGWNREVKDFIRRKFAIGYEPVFDDKKQEKLQFSYPQLPAIPNDETVLDLNLSPAVKRFIKELDATDMTDDFESHTSLVMDCIEDMTADLDEMTHLSAEAKNKIECIKYSLVYFRKHLGYFFDQQESEEDDDDDDSYSKPLDFDGKSFMVMNKTKKNETNNGDK